MLWKKLHFTFVQQKVVQFKAKKMGKPNQWKQEEDQIILKEFYLNKSRKWKHISKKLFQNGFSKSQTECRERYVNHLDPKLSKQKEITDQQLQIIHQKYQEYGPKWCLIQTYVPQRTQIRIKNIFYGNIRLFLKKVYKYFAKKTAVFINQLKTQELQAIYEGIQQFQGLNMIQFDFKKFSYRINAQASFTIIKENKKKYLELLNRIISNKTKLAPILSKQKRLSLERTRLTEQNAAKIIKQQKQNEQKQEQKNHLIKQISGDISQSIPYITDQELKPSFDLCQLPQIPLNRENDLLNLIPFMKYSSFNYQVPQAQNYCDQGFANNFFYQNSFNPMYYPMGMSYQMPCNDNMFTKYEFANKQNKYEGKNDEQVRQMKMK